MSVTGTVRDVVHVVRDRELTFMAAAIAHYTLASIVPLLLLALALATLVGGEAFIESVVRNRLAPFLSGSGRQVLLDAMTGVEGQVGAGVVGIAVALWSGSKVFRGLVTAFAELYEHPTSPSILEQLRDAVVVMGLLVLALAAMVAVGTVLSVVRVPVPSPLAVGTAVLFLALVLVLLPIYYVLTPGDASVGDVLPGTLVAAGGFIVLQVAFFYYAQHADQYKALGVLGAVLLFITWLYFGGIVLLFGGAVNYVTRTSAR